MAVCLNCGTPISKALLKICKKCFEEQEQWCQICGKTITYDQFKKAKGFYCEDCDKILTSSIDNLDTY
jgi:formamidopyrimidine-DNA glycosylase